MHCRPMNTRIRTRRHEVAELRAALAACQERASVLAHERDRARQLVASLPADQVVEPLRSVAG